MDEDKIIVRKLIDLANKAYKCNIVTYSSFLSLSQISLFMAQKKDFDFVEYNLYGGSLQSERKIIAFRPFNSDYLEYEYPIDIIKISPLSLKYSEVLNHRDYLGAIMNLGIERQTIGDIYCQENEAYVCALSKISSYLLDNLDQIKHTHIKMEMLEPNQDNFISSKTEEIELISASQRVDAIVSAITKLSRTKSIELFNQKKIYVNDSSYENYSHPLKEGDILVIRGFGKYIYQGSNAQTRKGKAYIRLIHYI